MEADRKWLEEFPAEHRGAVANWFYETVRTAAEEGDAAPSPRLLCSTLARRLWTEAEQYGSTGRVDRRQVMARMRDDPAGALALMAWVIAREGRSPEEKQRDKEETEAEGKRRHMESLPPTQKQLDTLLRLGVDELPANRWRASELIEQWKTW